VQEPFIQTFNVTVSVCECTSGTPTFNKKTGESELHARHERAGNDYVAPERVGRPHVFDGQGAKRSAVGGDE
jgi:hypothetical protein